ncbi:MAG: hypothetical protein AAF456_11535 [Planctomycetota bacterium]
MSKKKQEIENIDDNEIVTWAEEKLGNLKPYASQIALGAALLFAAFVAISYYIAWRQDQQENEWRELNVSSTSAAMNGDSSTLVELYDQFPDKPVGMWSLQLAGDFDLRVGLQTINSDREEGRKLIEKAKDSFQKIIDASDSLKSNELADRSVFSMAYACESLGQFDEAKGFYDQLAADDDSIFQETALRGAERCTNDTLIAMYKQFEEYEDEAAPGALTPDRPRIDLPDFDYENLEQPNLGGGSFQPGGNTAEEATETPVEVAAAPEDAGGSAPAPPVDEGGDDDSNGEDG